VQKLKLQAPLLVSAAIRVNETKISAKVLYAVQGQAHLVALSASDRWVEGEGRNLRTDARAVALGLMGWPAWKRPASSDGGLFPSLSDPSPLASSLPSALLVPF